MCGRFTLHAPPQLIREAFSLFRDPELAPRYNIAPSQPIAVVRFDENRTPREWDLLRWGLIPSWAKDSKIGYKMINARGETVASKPSFRAAFKRRRCLIPADGFYEWEKRDEGPKQPWYMTQPDGEPFAFAGLWESWSDPDGGVIESCTIITTEANDEMARLHDRMPVILPPDDYDVWLDPSIEEAKTLQPLLVPYEGELKFTPVSTEVNSPRHDSPDCIRPLPEQGQLFD
ncbi:Putative SOS response-associated peptidase YedK [Maioricimonas rarisocia]|uniref:Abasic site processing protein n=1 Tax=Maioricimonas rarisocia TaxID=2528026 RepID=A0A517ZAD3_9PLAN|nr:SOS response-associated peptidase [Maioricimonas rarisocia]QDU39428.1 Putative SOS response-associated peptidase YedK [Maioricimonas rarisocia]